MPNVDIFDPMMIGLPLLNVVSTHSFGELSESMQVDLRQVIQRTAVIKGMPGSDADGFEMRLLMESRTADGYWSQMWFLLGPEGRFNGLDLREPIFITLGMQKK